MQEQINKELTSRMEEDKVREAGSASANGVSSGAGAGAGAGAVDEAKEEDNYGEEVVEEEE